MYSMFIPLVLAFLPLSIGVGIIYLVRISAKRKRIKTPLVRPLLRAPGSSLSTQIDELSERIESYLIILSLIPLTSYSVYITHLYVNRLQADPFEVWFLAVMIVGVSAFHLVKLVAAWKERRKLRLAHDGEVAVAQELAPLMLDGYYVFHDFPAEKFNIDHIAVGRAGVFAIETKARTKRAAKSGGKDAEVICDGKSLKFPSHTETKPIEQTKIQANWLSKWISSSVGEPVTVSSILTLPGWYVRRITPDGIAALNPRQIPPYISKRKEELPKAMIMRIVHQLDQRCRDVEAKAFGR